VRPPPVLAADMAAAGLVAAANAVMLDAGPRAHATGPPANKAMAAAAATGISRMGGQTSRRDERIAAFRGGWRPRRALDYTKEAATHPMSKLGR
jgi:hypothetical protein